MNFEKYTTQIFEQYDKYINFKIYDDFSYFLELGDYYRNSGYESAYNGLKEILNQNKFIGHDITIGSLFENKALELSNKFDSGYHCLKADRIECLIKDYYFQEALDSAQETDSIIKIYKEATKLAYIEFFEKNLNTLFINKILEEYEIEDEDLAVEIIEQLSPIDEHTGTSYIVQKEYEEEIKHLL